MIDHQALLERFAGLRGLNSLDTWPFERSTRTLKELSSVSADLGGHHWTFLASSKERLLITAEHLIDNMPLLTANNLARVLPALLIVCEYITECSKESRGLNSATGRNLNPLKDNLIYSLEPPSELLEGIVREYSKDEAAQVCGLFPDEPETYHYLDFNYLLQLRKVLADSS